MKIGFFDSGLGGFAIMSAVEEFLPQYQYEFFGDTKHLPLGDKTEEEIYAITRAGIVELFKKDCVLVIIACNTASAESLRKIQDTLVFHEYPDRRVLGVIIPTIEALIESRASRALLIGTKRTIDSRKYDKELEKQAIVHPLLISHPTPELVPFIERGEIEEATSTAQNCIDRFIAEEKGIDSVILGCTHYVYLKKPLRAHYGHAISILSQDEIIPEKLARYLTMHPEIEHRLR